MRFIFDESKATDAAILLIRLNDSQSMDHAMLLKLLYLSDRRSFVEVGYPIMGATMVAMEYGPVLSEVYDCIKGAPRFEVWPTRLKNDGVRVALLDPNDVEELQNISLYAEKILRDVFEQYGHWDLWGEHGLIEELHRSLKEWQSSGTLTIPIDERLILEDAGLTKAEIDVHIAMAEGLFSMHRMVSSMSMDCESDHLTQIS